MLLLDQVLAFLTMPAWQHFWCFSQTVSQITLLRSICAARLQTAPVQTEPEGGMSCAAESCAACSSVEKWKCFMSTHMGLLEAACSGICGTISSVLITHLHKLMPSSFSELHLCSWRGQQTLCYQDSGGKSYKNRDTGGMPPCTVCRHSPHTKRGRKVFSRQTHLTRVIARFDLLPSAPSGLIHHSWDTRAEASLKLLPLMKFPLSREVRDIFWPRTSMTQQH